MTGTRVKRQRKATSPYSSEQGLATVRQAVEYLKIGRTKVYSLMKSGELTYVTIGSARRIQWVSLRKLAGELEPANT